MDRDRMLRDQLINLLNGGNAHASVARVLDGVSADQAGRRPPGQSHTIWRLLEHIRIAQWDILEYCRNPDHQSPTWPDGYWPDDDGPADADALGDSLRRFEGDLAELTALIEDPGTDLLEPIPWGGDGHTLCREALVAADHNAYHLGQIATLRSLVESGAR